MSTGQYPSALTHETREGPLINDEPRVMLTRPHRLLLVAVVAVVVVLKGTTLVSGADGGGVLRVHGIGGMRAISVPFSPFYGKPKTSPRGS